MSGDRSNLSSDHLDSLQCLSDDVNKLIVFLGVKHEKANIHFNTT